MNNDETTVENYEERSVTIHNAYPEYIEAELQHFNIEDTDLSVLINITRLSNRIQQLRVYISYYDKDNNQLNWEDMAYSYEEVNFASGSGNSRDVEFDARTLNIEKLGQLHHIICSIIVCNNNGDLATFTPGINWVNEHSTYNRAYGQKYIDDNGKERRFIYMPAAATFNKPSVVYAVTDPNWQAERYGYPELEPEQHFQLTPNNNTIMIPSAFILDDGKLENSFGFGETVLIPYELEQVAQDVAVKDTFQWKYDNDRTIGFSCRNNEYYMRFNLLNSSYRYWYEYHIWTEWAEGEDVEIGSGVIHTEGEATVEYILNNINTINNLVKIKIVTIQIDPPRVATIINDQDQPILIGIINKVDENYQNRTTFDQTYGILPHSTQEIYIYHDRPLSFSILRYDYYGCYNIIQQWPYNDSTQTIEIYASQLLANGQYYSNACINVFIPETNFMESPESRDVSGGFMTLTNTSSGETYYLRSTGASGSAPVVGVCETHVHFYSCSSLYLVFQWNPTQNNLTYWGFYPYTSANKILTRNEYRYSRILIPNGIYHVSLDGADHLIQTESTIYLLGANYNTGTVDSEGNYGTIRSCVDSIGINNATKFISNTYIRQIPSSWSDRLIVGEEPIYLSLYYYNNGNSMSCYLEGNNDSQYVYTDCYIYIGELGTSGIVDKDFKLIWGGSYLSYLYGMMNNCQTYSYLPENVMSEDGTQHRYAVIYSYITDPFPLPYREKTINIINDTNIEACCGLDFYNFTDLSDYNRDWSEHNFQVSNGRTYTMHIMPNAEDNFNFNYFVFNYGNPNGLYSYNNLIPWSSDNITLYISDFLNNAQYYTRGIFALGGLSEEERFQFFNNHHNVSLTLNNLDTNEIYVAHPYWSDRPSDYKTNFWMLPSNERRLSRNLCPGFTQTFYDTFNNPFVTISGNTYTMKSVYRDGLGQVYELQNLNIALPAGTYTFQLLLDGNDDDYFVKRFEMAFWDNSGGNLTNIIDLQYGWDSTHNTTQTITLDHDAVIERIGGWVMTNRTGEASFKIMITQGNLVWGFEEYGQIVPTIGIPVINVGNLSWFWDNGYIYCWNFTPRTSQNFRSEYGYCHNLLSCGRYSYTLNTPIQSLNHSGNFVVSDFSKCLTNQSGVINIRDYSDYFFYWITNRWGTHNSTTWTTSSPASLQTFNNTDSFIFRDKLIDSNYKILDISHSDNSKIYGGLSVYNSSILHPSGIVTDDFFSGNSYVPLEDAYKDADLSSRSVTFKADWYEIQPTATVEVNETKTLKALLWQPQSIGDEADLEFRGENNILNQLYLHNRTSNMILDYTITVTDNGQQMVSGDLNRTQSQSAYGKTFTWKHILMPNTGADLMFGQSPISGYIFDGHDVEVTITGVQKYITGQPPAPPSRTINIYNDTTNPVVIGINHDGFTNLNDYNCSTFDYIVVLESRNADNYRDTYTFELSNNFNPNYCIVSVLNDKLQGNYNNLISWNNNEVLNLTISEFFDGAINTPKQYVNGYFILGGLNENECNSLQEADTYLTLVNQDTHETFMNNYNTAPYVITSSNNLIPKLNDVDVTDNKGHWTITNNVWYERKLDPRVSGTNTHEIDVHIPLEAGKYYMFTKSLPSSDSFTSSPLDKYWGRLWHTLNLYDANGRLLNGSAGSYSQQVWDRNINGYVNRSGWKSLFTVSADTYIAKIKGYAFWSNESYESKCEIGLTEVPYDGYNTPGLNSTSPPKWQQSVGTIQKICDIPEIRFNTLYFYNQPYMGSPNIEVRNFYPWTSNNFGTNTTPHKCLLPLPEGNYTYTLNSTSNSSIVHNGVLKIDQPTYMITSARDYRKRHFNYDYMHIITNRWGTYNTASWHTLNASAAQTFTTDSTVICSPAVGEGYYGDCLDIVQNKSNVLYGNFSLYSQELISIYDGGVIVNDFFDGNSYGTLDTSGFLSGTNEGDFRAEWFEVSNSNYTTYNDTISITATLNQKQSINSYADINFTGSNTNSQYDTHQGATIRGILLYNKSSNKILDYSIIVRDNGSQLLTGDLNRTVNSAKYGKTFVWHSYVFPGMSANLIYDQTLYEDFFDDRTLELEIIGRHYNIT